MLTQGIYFDIDIQLMRNCFHTVPHFFMFLLIFIVNLIINIIIYNKMGKYIKLFENHTQYETFTATTEFIKPNVSHCKEEVEVHYNPWTPPMNIITYEASAMLTEGGMGQYGPENGYNPAAFGTTLVSHTFENGKGKFTFEDNVASIGDYAFYQCSSLSSVTIPNSVTSIGTDVFYNCSSLTSIDIPSGVTTIGDYAFFGCCSLESVTIPNSVTSIGYGAFGNCSGLTSVTIPNSVTSIGDEAFFNCTSLPIENNIRYADTYAIGAIDRTLTTYTLKEGTRFIDGNGTVTSSCFGGCSNLTSITIPNSVISIGANAFYGCSSLTSITSNATTAPTIQRGTFNNVKTNGTLYVPQGSSGYDVWMQNANYYLGKYGWTKVEQ